MMLYYTDDFLCFADLLHSLMMEIFTEVSGSCSLFLLEMFQDLFVFFAIKSLIVPYLFLLFLLSFCC